MKYKYTLEGNTNVSFKIMFLFYLHLANEQPENSNLKSTATKYICDNLLLTLAVYINSNPHTLSEPSLEIV